MSIGLSIWEAKKKFIDFCLKSIIFFAWLQLVGFFCQWFNLCFKSISFVLALHSCAQADPSKYRIFFLFCPKRVHLVHKVNFTIIIVSRSHPAKSVAYQMTKKCKRFSTSSFVIDTRRERYESRTRRELKIIKEIHANEQNIYRWSGFIVWFILFNLFSLSDLQLKWPLIWRKKSIAQWYLHCLCSFLLDLIQCIVQQQRIKIKS